MKLQVLGCWAPYPIAGEACSGYLVKAHDGHLLLDLGHGVFSKLQEVHHHTDLDAVFISHLHWDHFADLSCLRHALLGSMRQGLEVKRLPLYIPAQPSDLFHMISLWDDAFEITPLEGGLIGDIPVMGEVYASFFPVSHPILTYGISLFKSEKKFVYSGDTGYDESLIEYIQGADTFLCEASLMEEDIHNSKWGHLTSKQAGRLSEKSGVGELILTHFWPDYDLGKLKEEARGSFKGALYTAEQFGIYNV
ncbi:MAG: MBL fold metallo-hydrolase [Clostridia bacterium]|nr:MBL fold metallo-hydrolase [Clostridia bacterium]